MILYMGSIQKSCQSSTKSLKSTRYSRLLKRSCEQIWNNWQRHPRSTEQSLPVKN